MNNKKSLFFLLIIMFISVIGLSFSFFADTTTFENVFGSNKYGTTITETFVSPVNWLPGDVTNKNLIATNTGDVAEAVRISYSESWIDSNGNSLSLIQNNNRISILNFVNNSDWKKIGDYYYYIYKLAPNSSTSSLIDSVSFNQLLSLDDNCVQSNNNGTIITTCSSSGEDYDNATYSLTFTIETVEFDKYKDVWGIDFNILESTLDGENFANYLINNSNTSDVVNYLDGDITKLYSFNNSVTFQTSFYTNYRFIGNEPNNYVYFNCDSNGENCEIWRIIGVFIVENSDGNTERRVKLVSGFCDSDNESWNNIGDESDINNWNVSSLNLLLNGTYYNSLSDSAKEMISSAKYYLGGTSVNNNFGSTENIYLWERGNDVFTNRPLSWNGKIALMYPSDQYYVYSKGVNDYCFSNPSTCELIDAETGWIFNSNKMLNSSSIVSNWLLSSSSSNTTNVFLTNDNGTLVSMNAYSAYAYYSVRPVLYLDSSVRVVDGDGSSSDPYKLDIY